MHHYNINITMNMALNLFSLFSSLRYIYIFFAFCLLVNIITKLTKKEKNSGDLRNSILFLFLFAGRLRMFSSSCQNRTRCKDISGHVLSHKNGYFKREMEACFFLCVKWTKHSVFPECSIHIRLNCMEACLPASEYLQFSRKVII